jgi:hypothetical protein
MVPRGVPLCALESAPSVPPFGPRAGAREENEKERMTTLITVPCSSLRTVVTSHRPIYTKGTYTTQPRNQKPTPLPNLAALRSAHPRAPRSPVRGGCPGEGHAGLSVSRGISSSGYGGSRSHSRIRYSSCLAGGGTCSSGRHMVRSNIAADREHTTCCPQHASSPV